jgi:hypothetical protein
LDSANRLVLRNTVMYRPADVEITYTYDDEGNATSVCLYAIYNGNMPLFD